MYYEWQALKEAWTRGERFEFTKFFGHTGCTIENPTNACFSQWFPCTFKVDEVTYNCMEQYMMAEKARLFKDGYYEHLIMKSKSPKEIKAYGRAVRNFDEKVWYDHCRDIVRKGNIAKFTQNPTLKEYLLQTGQNILVEASPYDRIWGIKRKVDDPKSDNPLQWLGYNYLGFALTYVRDYIKENNL